MNNNFYETEFINPITTELITDYDIINTENFLIRENEKEEMILLDNEELPF